MIKITAFRVLLCISLLAICSQLSLAQTFKKVTKGIDKGNEKLRTECDAIYNKIQLKSKSPKDNATLIKY